MIERRSELSIFKKMLSMVFWGMLAALKWIFLALFYYFPIWPWLLGKCEVEDDEVGAGSILVLIESVLVGWLMLVGGAIFAEGLHWSNWWLPSTIYSGLRIFQYILSLLYYKAKESVVRKEPEHNEESLLS